jgi:hypothetical protein
VVAPAVPLLSVEPAAPLVGVGASVVIAAPPVPLAASLPSPVWPVGAAPQAGSDSESSKVRARITAW